MHFRAKEVGVCGGDSGVILGFNLNWIENELKADYRNIYKQSVLIGGVVVAVAHDEFKGKGLEDVSKCMNIKPVLVDAGGLFSEEGAKKNCFYYKSS